MAEIKMCREEFEEQKREFYRFKKEMQALSIDKEQKFTANIEEYKSEETGLNFVCPPAPIIRPI